MRISRLSLLVLAFAATFAIAAPTVPASGQTTAVLIGEVPFPGASGLLAVSGGTTRTGLIEALRARACEPSSVWVRTAAGWASYIRGAPAFVNDRFPLEFPSQAHLFVRCLAEVEVTVPHGDIVLAGTLTLPASPPPYAAVILVSGGGPQDRDEATEGLPGYRPFAWIADHLQQEGIAVLRYDDRGVARSTGEHEGATSADFADDAEAVLEFLRARPGIDPARVGIAGHSEGGLIAGIVAARNPNVAFVVSLAGPGIDGDAVLDLQTRLILEALGLPPEVVAAELATSRQARALTLAGDWVALEALLRAMGEQQLAALPEEVRATIDFDAIIAAELLHYQTWMRFFLAHDPAEDYARIGVPVLGIFGGLDLQVPAEENIAGLAAALAAAGNEDVTFVTVPTANHLFQPAVTGSPEEYPHLPMSFVPGLLETLSDWLRERFGSSQ